MLLLFCKAIFNYVRSLDPLDPLQIWVGTRNLYIYTYIYIYIYCLGFYLMVFVFTALCYCCSKEKVVSYVADWGNTLLKFRFNSALGDIFQGVLLLTCFPLALLWSLIALTILTGIICKMSRLLLQLQFKVILIGTFII